MRLLLDTHILVWLTHAPNLLRAKECELIEASGDVLVSALSIWEIRIKWNSRHPSGDRKGDLAPIKALNFAKENGFALIDLSLAHTTAELRHPVGNRDPFDEQLLIQAQELGARLLTRDRSLAGHPLAIGASA